MNRFHVVLWVPEYAANAMTADTAKFIRIETVRRSKVKYGEDYAMEKTLEQFGITLTAYERLKQFSHFYLTNGCITVPSRQVRGMLKDTVRMTKQPRVQGGLVSRIDRMLITPDEIPTGKIKEDAMFGRPVLLKAATGKQESSGRWDYTETPLLKDVRLDFTVETDFADEELKPLFEEGARRSGIGGCRKVGKGQFTVGVFEEK